MQTFQQRSGVNQVSPADIELRNQIQAEMHGHGAVDATKIGVVVRGGQVLLWGSVASEQERTLAAEIAARITARAAIINHIQVLGTTQS
ncbi:MAG TPA: BON domain-containing protein [Polyangiaceae bacterium]|nr:BON domain-containing protein [Polyangiaceae bacterium]